MADYSKFCKCSPVIKIPTREDLLHPLSHITPEELLKYRKMRSLRGTGGQQEISQYSELDKTKNGDLQCAEASLARYNDLHSTNYKLIEVTKRNGFFHGWVWHHCLFKAAPETSSVPETFFAELHGLGSKEYHVVTVARVENAITESYDCRFCFGKDILHPVLTLSRDPDALFSEGRTYTGVAPEFQESYEELKKTLNETPHLEPFSQTYAFKHEPPVHSRQISEAEFNSIINAKHKGYGKMHDDIVPIPGVVYWIDGVNTLVCEDTKQTITTDAAPSHSPILPLVDVAPMAIKGNPYDASGTGCGVDNVQNKENIQARISVKRKASEGVSPPR